MISAFLLLVVGALPDSLVSKWDLHKGESLVVARIVVKDTSGARLMASGLRVTGKGSVTKAVASDSEFVVFKLRSGVHELELLSVAKRKFEIASGFMKFEVPKDQDLYSLGTVTFKLRPPPPRDRQEVDGSGAIGMGAAVGGLVGAAMVASLQESGSRPVDCCPLDALNFLEEDQATAGIQSRFPESTPHRIRLEVDHIAN